MTFLAAASHHSLLLQQKAKYMFQKQLIIFQEMSIQGEIASVENEYNQSAIRGENADMSDQDKAYLDMLDKLGTQIDIQKETIEDQITVIENEISTLKDMVKNNVKSSCGLTLSGGSS